MKQIIVLISSVVLGIAIAGMVVGFESDAQNIADIAINSLESFAETF